jgi:hypothetical protein
MTNSARQFKVMELWNRERARIPCGGVSQSLVPKHLANIAEQRSRDD